MPVPAPPRICWVLAPRYQRPEGPLCYRVGTWRPGVLVGRPTGGRGPAVHFGPMTRGMLERRLSDVAIQLKELRRELAVTDEQLAQLADEADDARLRSLVSETPIAEREHREAARHAEAMGRHRTDVLGSIQRLEQQQDDLLDRLNEAVG